MTRFVLRLERPVNGDPQVRMEEPLDHPNADMPFRIDPRIVRGINDMFNQNPLPPGTIRDVGIDLLGVLATHDAVRDQVLPMLDVQSQVESAIYLMIRDPELESLPWEALHGDNCGFASANRKWPIARARKLQQSKSDATFIPPLKVMAILGASGEDSGTHLPADAEFDSLKGALKSSRLNVLLKVLVCQEDLQKKIDGLALDWILPTELLADRADLFNDVRAFEPHLLHFFCHGIADPTPRLEIASALNWERRERGSIIVEGPDLRDRGDPQEKTWLVTLNCCESAMQGTTPGSRSLPLASALVNAGFPAAVGMRERVEIGLAHIFCRLFYDALLTELGNRFETAAQEGLKEIHWACGLYAARQAICENVDPTEAFSDAMPNRKEWTIPVLYTRLQPFGVRLMPDPDGTHPLFKPAAGAPAAPTGNAGAQGTALTAKDIRPLAEEMEQLTADRERFKQLAPVVKKIDDRLNEIQKLLA